MENTNYLTIFLAFLCAILGYMLKPMISFFFKRNGNMNNGNGNSKVTLARIEENRQAIREHAKDMEDRVNSLGDHFQRIENLLTSINSSIGLNTETIKLKFSNFDEKFREVREMIRGEQ